MKYGVGGKRRDTNEAAVVHALERVGAQVLRLDRFDLLVWYQRRLYMLDVKMVHGRLTKTQAALSEHGWPLVYVHDVEEALRAIRAWP